MGENYFCALVAECLFTKEGLMWKFSRQVQHNVLTYFYIGHEQEQNINEEGLHEVNIKSTIDFDVKFINHCFQK
jgi:hypothetical protein